MRIILSLLLVAISACSPAPSTVAAAAADTASVKSDVAALIRAWSAAGAEGRWDDLKAIYADDPDFYWVEQGRVAYAGHAAVVAGVDQVAAMGATMTSSVDEIVVTPLGSDSASFRARAEIAVASSSFSFDFKGAFTGVAVKRDGEWRLLQGHLSAEEQRAP